MQYTTEERPRWWTFIVSVTTVTCVGFWCEENSGNVILKFTFCNNMISPYKRKQYNIPTLLDDQLSTSRRQPCLVIIYNLSPVHCSLEASWQIEIWYDKCTFLTFKMLNLFLYENVFIWNINHIKWDVRHCWIKGYIISYHSSVVL